MELIQSIIKSKDLEALHTKIERFKLLSSELSSYCTHPEYISYVNKGLVLYAALSKSESYPTYQTDYMKAPIRQAPSVILLTTYIWLSNLYTKELVRISKLDVKKALLEKQKFDIKAYEIFQIWRTNSVLSPYYLQISDDWLKIRAAISQIGFDNLNESEKIYFFTLLLFAKIMYFC